MRYVPERFLGLNRDVVWPKKMLRIISFFYLLIPYLSGVPVRLNVAPVLLNLISKNQFSKTRKHRLFGGNGM